MQSRILELSAALAAIPVIPASAAAADPVIVAAREARRLETEWKRAIAERRVIAKRIGNLFIDANKAGDKEGYLARAVFAIEARTLQGVLVQTARDRCLEGRHRGFRRYGSRGLRGRSRLVCGNAGRSRAGDERGGFGLSSSRDK